MYQTNLGLCLHFMYAKLSFYLNLLALILSSLALSGHCFIAIDIKDLIINIIVLHVLKRLGNLAQWDLGI